MRWTNLTGSSVRAFVGLESHFLYEMTKIWKFIIFWKKVSKFQKIPDWLQKKKKKKLLRYETS